VAPQVHAAPTLAAPLAPPGFFSGGQTPPGGTVPPPPGPPGVPGQPGPYGQPGPAAQPYPAQQQSYGQPVAPPQPHPGPQAPYGAPAAPQHHAGAAPAPGVQVAFDKYREAPNGQRWTLQNHSLIRVDLGADPQPVLARQGSMVLYQGKVDFGYKGAGFMGRIVGNATGQEMQLMRCTGRGQVFLAENSAHLHPIQLENDAICVSADAVLAFDESLHHEVRRIDGHGIPGGALFTMQFQGTGTVVVKTHGTPVVLPVTPTTYADSNAIVAWSAGSQVVISSQVRLRRTPYPGQSGETVNLQFRGAPGNFIVVQPYEV
ncbi:AIM24 family protein, partial [Streptomyces sp. SCA3-4]|uniref:AIM24 family protein n=1 Tax=Streptomyces sichuanensis TaxID=2871810 RepID=UPI001CE2A96D